MAYGNEILERLENLDIQKEVQQVASLEEERFRELQQLQLVKGKDRNGDYLPKYTEDPYFKGDYEAAIRYRDWKVDISPDVSKPIDVMDFWIRGDFNASIRVHINGDKVDVFSDADIEADVLRKTGGKAFGINPESAQRLWDDYIRPQLINIIQEQTGIK